MRTKMAIPKPLTHCEMATSLFHNSQTVRGFLLTPVTMPFCRHSAKQNAIFFNQEHIYHKDK